MQLKRTIITLAAAGMVSSQAYAGEAQVHAAVQPIQPVAAFTEADMAALFEAADKPMQIAALSEQEMRETEGAVIWFAPIAWTGVRYALTGFTRHGLNQVISRGGVGVSNQAILDALRNPLPGSLSFISGPNAGTTRYIGTNATVVLNQSGQLVSAWARNSSGWR